MEQVTIGKEKGAIRFDKIGEDTLVLKFRSDLPAYFEDKELGTVKSPEGVEFELPVSLNTVVSLYLKLKTFEESFKSMEDSIIIQENGKRVVIYRHKTKPYFLTIKGIDYNQKKAGIIYIDITNYAYVLFLAYLKAVLSKFPLLSYNLTKDVSLAYNREDKILTILDTDLDKFHYIEEDELHTARELLDTYCETNGEILFTHSFTPDRNVFIDKSGVFQINDKAFELVDFKKFVYLISI